MDGQLGKKKHLFLFCQDFSEVESASQFLGDQFVSCTIFVDSKYFITRQMLCSIIGRHCQALIKVRGVLRRALQYRTCSSDLFQL